MGKKKRHKSISWDDAIPTQEYFNELFRVSQNQIIWGQLLSTSSNEACNFLG